MRALLLAALALLVAPPAAAQEKARFDWFSYTGSNPADGHARAGARDYRNPILGGFYPDPSVTRVGEDYYLVTSTFGWFPGIPVFHSRDLVHWTQIGNAIDRSEQLNFGKLGLSRGVFAPTIQAKDGVFYILNTCVDCGGNFVITAKNPAGPWSAPVWLPDLEGGIDPSLFFDDDGRTWIVNNGPPEGKPLYEGHRAIWVQEFNPRGLQTIGPRTLVVNGGADIAKKPIWIEGPHILKKDGFYYLICAEGGTSEGHSQVVLRSRNVTGPYEAWRGNPILTQRDLKPGRRFPITSSGHAQLVQTQKGDWWATFLATQPYEGDYYNTGRETFLLPVTWIDGWPRITGPGQPIARVHGRPNLPLAPAAGPRLGGGGFTVRDEFDGPDLPLNWMMMRNPQGHWYAFDRGALVLTPRAVGLGDNGNPAFLARRQQHMDASATTVVRFAPRGEGDRAGLAALQNDDYWMSLAVTMRGGRRVVLLSTREGPKQPAGGVDIKSAVIGGLGDAPVWLRMTAAGGRYRFDYAVTAGRWLPLAAIDGKLLSTKAAGGFVGTMMGVYAQSMN
ncbi:glycoside hydrolase family 43 protein [Sphingomonas sp.]|uniref:glycoside hydrolase family 43 protein n=1 Tax=Sphingomonas sp. TaxID=28214 RepID=UPI001B062C6A|nr:glycoside hydrolase family 43 protein [Sphingomonas sp.]MBO9713430.1 glycoside hydrolase family 43 protein [Sphingomonas sp.]